ncbi:MAG: polysaccharide deacetylase family protein [Firmicutes bacterium]|nr:polysaccharide deacetylase family protein [Bacillota bacterium]
MPVHPFHPSMQPSRLWTAITAAAFLLLLFLLTRSAWLPAASSSRLLPVYEVDTDQPFVAVSFDASWGAEHTQDILDVLDSYGVKTTFFLVNLWLEDYPEQAKEIVARGHEIGLHSATHPDMAKLSRQQMEGELNDNYALIEETTGITPVLFRPPYGSYNDELIAASFEAGFTPVQWSVDSLDWQDLSADEIFRRVTSDIHAGDIVLFHNNGLHTAEALPRILDYFQQQGLQVVPLSRMLRQDDWYVDVNGVQRGYGE